MTWANGYPAYTALGRKPLPPVSTATKSHIESEFADILRLERSLEKQGYTGLGLRQGGDSSTIKGMNGSSNGHDLLDSVKQAVTTV